MEKPIKVAVIGVGHLGSQHARIYSGLPGAEFIGVVDANHRTAVEVANKNGCKNYSNSFLELMGQIQAVSIATPTSDHFDTVKFFIKAGINVLIEKPMAMNVKEADELISLAEKSGSIIQVGHVERFNGAVQELFRNIDQPQMIECVRLSPFSGRSTDIDVIMDLMIHDIDIVLGLTKSKIRSIEASGFSVLTQKLDVVSTRIEFESGCIVNLTASRISREKERKIRVFQHPYTYTVDCITQEISTYRPGVSVKKTEPLRAELESFIEAVALRKEPVVTGVHGRDALEVAEMIRCVCDETP